MREDLLCALEQRDGEHASRLMREHIHTSRILLNTLF